MINRLNFLQFFVLYASGMKILAHKINLTESDVDDEFIICKKITQQDTHKTLSNYHRPNHHFSHVHATFWPWSE